VVEEIGPEHFWNGKDPLGVRDVGENLVLEEVGKDGGPFGATRRAHSSAFAREGDQELVGAARTSHPGEAGRLREATASLAEARRAQAGFEQATVVISGDGSVVETSPEPVASLKALFP
jgi:hypothetical protein